MIWPFYAALAAVLAIPADRDRRNALLLIIAGLFAVFGLYASLERGPADIAHSLLWVVIGLTIATSTLGKLWLPALLLVAAGALVAPARWLGHEYEILASPWLVSSDVCGVAAIVVLGAPGLGQLVSRIRDMGRSRRNRPVGGLSDMAAKKTQ